MQSRTQPQDLAHKEFRRNDGSAQLETLSRRSSPDGSPVRGRTLPPRCDPVTFSSVDQLTTQLALKGPDMEDQPTPLPGGLTPVLQSRGRQPRHPHRSGVTAQSRPLRRPRRAGEGTRLPDTAASAVLPASRGRRGLGQPSRRCSR